jgi:hypothetical protein
MNWKSRISMISAALLIAGVAIVATGQRRESRDSAVDVQWEYLVVAGGSANLSTAGNENYPGMRKQPDNSFPRENFPLERNFDKLGAKGWELVAVYGPPPDPVYFFKRIKDKR